MSRSPRVRPNNDGMQGLIFAVGMSHSSDSVKLYDLRSFDKGPFSTWKIPYSEHYAFSSIKFSNDGKRILLGTYNGCTLMLDAFEGALVRSTCCTLWCRGLALRCWLCRRWVAWARLTVSPACLQLAKFEGYRNESQAFLEASFSPDAQFVSIGSEDGSIHVWDVNTLQHQARHAAARCVVCLLACRVMALHFCAVPLVAALPCPACAFVFFLYSNK